jgi:propionyl-CoA synthetase
LLLLISDVGWVVGHSFIIYGPLLHGCTSVLYEGKPVGTPDAANFWRVLARHKVSEFFAAPTAIRAIRREDEHGVLPKQFDLSSLRTIFLAGERADPATLRWSEEAFDNKVPVRDHWWQTETAWPICANLVGVDGPVPVKYGSSFTAVPGYNVQVLDDDNNPVPPGTIGNIAIKLPLPPGVLTSLYNAEQRFQEAYLEKIPGYYDTADAGFIDEDGYISIMSRTDDVINVAGHRLSSGAMEEVLSDHPEVAEVAVIGVRDELKGHLPLGLLVLNSNSSRNEEDVIKEVVAMVRQRIGAVAAFKHAEVVEKLPKTRSGKILRGTMRAIANGDAYKVPATIEDLAVLHDVEKIILNSKHLAAPINNK